MGGGGLLRGKLVRVRVGVRVRVRVRVSLTFLIKMFLINMFLIKMFLIKMFRLLRITLLLRLEQWTSNHLKYRNSTGVKGVNYINICNVY